MYKWFIDGKCTLTMYINYQTHLSRNNVYTTKFYTNLVINDLTLSQCPMLEAVCRSSGIDDSSLTSQPCQTDKLRSNSSFSDDSSEASYWASSVVILTSRKKTKRHIYFLITPSNYPFQAPVVYIYTCNMYKCTTI